MSGIAAILNLNGSTVPQSEVERMVNVLKPHGPDRQKTLALGNAAFVFCLHHLTPEDLYERQPLLFANRFVMLFDGRIDNRSELREALGIAANELRSMPDSMIALHLLNRWSVDGLARIVGDFAIIAMDLQNGDLICARDHMGLRILHYHCSAEWFAVATAPEALFALSWVPRILNKEQLGHTLLQTVPSGETTYYQGIDRVRPGYIVRVGTAKHSKERFWDPENIEEIRFKRDDDYVDAFRERLDTAVEASLRSSHTPCATITGGLDSSTIAVVAADMLSAKGNKLNTFTAVPETEFNKEEMSGCYFDETPYVRQIAEVNPNIIPHFIPPRKGPLLEQIVEHTQTVGLLGLSILNALWTRDILVAARSAGHNVMLTGNMGNITISYDGWLLLNRLLLTGRWCRLFSELQASGRLWRFKLRNSTIAPCIPAPLFRRYKQWRRGENPPWYQYAAVNPELAARLVDQAAEEGDFPFDSPPPRDSRRARISEIHTGGGLAEGLATLRAKFGMDLRTPAFNRRVFEFCVGIPEDQYLHKGRDRWLIRRAMKGRLPDTVLYNKKGGVQAADWFPRFTRERHRIMAELTRLQNNSDVASIVDIKKVAAILNAWPAHEPSPYGTEAGPFRWALPSALGAAYFVEDFLGSNFGR